MSIRSLSRYGRPLGRPDTPPERRRSYHSTCPDISRRGRHSLGRQVHSLAGHQSLGAAGANRHGVPELRAPPAPHRTALESLNLALDPQMICEVLDVMGSLAEQGMTMMIVTHEMAFARRVAHRVLFMERGRMLEDRDTASFFTEPHTARARDFLSKILQHDMV